MTRCAGQTMSNAMGRTFMSKEEGSRRGGIIDFTWAAYVFGGVDNEGEKKRLTRCARQAMSNAMGLTFMAHLTARKR